MGLLVTQLDGTIATLAPVSAETFRRLSLLQEKLVRALPHAGALHPRAFRAYRTGARSAAELNASLDGVLLGLYGQLPIGAQERMARQVGTRREVLLESLADLWANSARLF
jgi:hypothetical protein